VVRKKFPCKPGQFGILAQNFRRVKSSTENFSRHFDQNPKKNSVKYEIINCHASGANLRPRAATRGPGSRPRPTLCSTLHQIMSFEQPIFLSILLSRRICRASIHSCLRSRRVANRRRRSGYNRFLPCFSFPFELLIELNEWLLGRRGLGMVDQPSWVPAQGFLPMGDKVSWPRGSAIVLDIYKRLQPRVCHSRRLIYTSSALRHGAPRSSVVSCQAHISA